MERNRQQLPQSKVLIIWRAIKSWQFLYLVSFAVGLIMLIVYQHSLNASKLWVPFSFLALSFFIKIISHVWINKPTLRQFIWMQWSFIIPYIMTVINIVLGFQPYLAFSNSLIAQIAYPNENWYKIGVLNSVNFALSTVICSLIMDSRVKRFEFYAIFCLILLLTGVYLNQNVNLINSITSASDSIQDSLNQGLIDFISDQITAAQYSDLYTIIGDFQSTLDKAKDFGLAKIASIIAQLLIMLDVISRPHEEIRQRQQTYEGFKMKKQIQLNLLTHQSTLKQSTY